MNWRSSSASKDLDPKFEIALKFIKLGKDQDGFELRYINENIGELKYIYCLFYYS